MDNSGGKDILILVAIIAVVLVSWVSSDESRSDARNSSAQSPSTELSSSRSRSSGTQTREPSTRQEERQIEREIKQAQEDLEKAQEELVKLEKFGNSSPYKGKVTIVKRTSGPRADDVDKEYVELRASKENASVISLKGWRLKSLISGRSLEIEEASYLPHFGQVNTELPVNLRAGDKIYVTTGRSPIGVSFRVNKCSGYYQQFQKFTPRLKEQCPDPEDEILLYEGDRNIFIDNECLDFVERISRCEIRTSNIPKTLSFTCQEAIADEIGYSSCVEKHKDDDDFIQPEWRVYLKREAELWREKREIIALLDQDGKTVDVYSY